MPTKQVVYRPPETDSDEDDIYDGFMFGDYMKPERRYVRPVDQDLHDALLDGNLIRVQEEITQLKFNVDDLVKGSLPPLHIACQEGFYDIVKYLLKECNANVNKEVDRITPLLLACNSLNRDSNAVEDIIQLLLEHDAVINVSDIIGHTPFMWACENGYKNAVKLMINKVNLTAIDNEGNTALFRAIESNRREIVQMLIEAGADCYKPNRKGYTPTQVAQFHGFSDLLEILPKEKEVYIPPTEFIHNNTIEDYIPSIFPKTNCPEYFQAIYSILTAMNMEHTVKYFVEARTPLVEFLCLQDKDLENIGIEFPLHRMKIRRGLLDFHLNHWSSKSITCVTRSSEEDFCDILMIIANQMLHLVTIQASVQYVINNVENNVFGPVDMESIEDLERNLAGYRNALKQLLKTVTHLASFSPPKNPIHIGQEDRIALKEKPFLRGCIKYSIIIGISAFACFTLKRFFQ